MVNPEFLATALVRALHTPLVAALVIGTAPLLSAYIIIAALRRLYRD